MVGLLELRDSKAIRAEPSGRGEPCPLVAPEGAAMIFPAPGKLASTPCSHPALLIWLSGQSWQFVCARVLR